MLQRQSLGDDGNFDLLGGLLLLKVLGEEFLVSDSLLLTILPSLLLGSLVDNLSSDSLIGNESLDAWALVEGLVTSDECSSNDVLSDIILLSEGKGLSDVVSSLWSESSGLGLIGESGDIVLTLNENLKGDD